MSSNNIERSIRPPRPRESANGPKIGQVSRIRVKDAPEDGHGHRGVRRILQSPKWLAVSVASFALATLIAVGGGFMLWSKSRTRSAPSAVAEFSEEQVRVVSKFASPTADEALELVKRAVGARDVQVIGEVFRDGAARGDEILGFLKEMEVREGPAERFEWLSRMDANGLLVEGVAVVFRGRERATERIGLITPDALGIWRMDFDAFARTVTPSWKALLDEGAEQARVRVVVSRDYYHNGPFSSELEWTCYRMESQDTGKNMYGYVRVGTPAAVEMERILQEADSLSRATLDLQRVAGADSLQFEISRVVAKDWILPAEKQK